MSLFVRFGIASALIAAVCIAPRSARAQTLGNSSAYHGESPQNFAVEIRFAPYNSFVDSEFGAGVHPYCDIFSAPGMAVPVGGGLFTEACPQNPTLMGGAEFDWQVLRIGPVGSLGIGLNAMYTQASANGVFALGMAGLNIQGMSWARSSATPTSLFVGDLALVAVMRFDGLMRRFRYIPIVPYVKLGFAYGLWFATKGGNLETVSTCSVSTSPCPAMDSGTAQTMGGSPGWFMAAGISVLLDFFDPRMARELDATQGINHTYLFAEVYREDLSGFGNRHQLNVGDQNFVGGMAFEF